MENAQIQFNPIPNQQCYFYQSADTRIEVLQNQHHIWLEINGVVQSAIENKAPYRPVMPHTIAMFLPQVHDKIPNTILELGGGGQSAQRYLAMTQPQINFTSIEYSQEVINAIEAAMPQFDALNIIKADAFSYLAEQPQEQKFDWIMIDLFHGKTAPDAVFSKLFFQQCYERLNNEGWLIYNCLSNDTSVHQTLVNIAHDVFDTRVSLFAIPTMQNHILLVKKGQNFSFPSHIDQHNLATRLMKT